MNPATAATRPAAHATATPLTGLRLVPAHLRLSSMPAQARRNLPRGVRPDQATGAFYMQNDDGGLCLNANNAGPSAGENGDKVQLWNCYSTDNEIWYGYNLGGGVYWLVNYQYGLCLNANNTGGLGDGSPVQLWDCYGSANEYWNVGAWITSVDDGYWTPLTLLYGSDNFVLDANKYGIGNGDKVQIWTYYGGTNQLWY
jgi:hypothetical protein